MDYNSVWLFVKVVQTGSFSKAARTLKMPVSTVSTKVSLLEQQLDVSLLTRTTRQIRLTESGQRFFDHAVRAMTELQEAESIASFEKTAPQGTLRVTAPVDMGNVVSDLLDGFLTRYPLLKVDLILTDRVTDLVGEGIDVGLRAGELEDSSLVARRVGVRRFELFASPGYLKRRGTPRKPQDLEKHECLRFTAPGPGNDETWALSRGGSEVSVAVKGRFSADSLSCLHRLVLSGRGIGLLPNYICTQDVLKGRLVRLLADWTAEEIPFSLVYPYRRFVPQRVRVFIDYFIENVEIVLGRA